MERRFTFSTPPASLSEDEPVLSASVPTKNSFTSASPPLMFTVPEQDAPLMLFHIVELRTLPSTFSVPEFRLSTPASVSLFAPTAR